MQNKRVLVTGGAGFIGSNLANRVAAVADHDDELVDDRAGGVESAFEERAVPHG